MQPNRSYEQFADDAFVQIFRMTPEMVAIMGLSHVPEFDGLNDKLNDYSLVGVQTRQSKLDDIYQQHLAYDVVHLNQAEQLSYKVFEFFLQYVPFEPWAGVAGDDFTYYKYPVCHLDGAPTDTFNMLASFHDVNNENDARNYLARLKLLSKMFNDLEEGLIFREQHKLSPPKPALNIIIEEIKSMLLNGVGESELLISFQQKLADACSISDKKSAIFVDQAEVILSALYAKEIPSFLSCLQALELRSNDEIGVSRFERGDEYYQYCLIRQTTTNMTAEDIYAVGESEVARLKTELADDVAALGIDGTDLKNAIAQALRVEGDDAQDTEERRAEILAYYQQLVSNTAQKIRPYFNLYPRGECLVKPMPRHLELGGTTTYYPASVTGEYPGTFELNLIREINKPEWSRNNLAYHEAFPGHHLQIALAQELKHLPLFRRTFLNAGYLEGWAKYAERLPFETGIDTDARYELQRKAGELISASNLMLDVVLHTKDWSRDKCIEFSIENALIDRAMAEYLVDRITVTPGQTTAYVLGLITVRKQREKVQKRMQDKFNLPIFHDLILGEGALPLSVLEQRVDQAIV